MLALVTSCSGKSKPAPTPVPPAAPTKTEACAIAQQYVGFGALLRNVFSLHMTAQGGGRYTLTDIKLQPQ